MSNSIELLRDKFRTGIPELYLPALEPLELEEIVTIANSERIKVHANNVKLYGLYRCNITDIANNFDAQVFDLNVGCKTIGITGDYNVTANVLVPLTGKGPVDIDASNE